MRIIVTGANGMVGRNLLEHPGMDSFEFFAPLRDELDLFDSLAAEKYLNDNPETLYIIRDGIY